MDELAGQYPPLHGVRCLDLANTFEPDTPAGGCRDHLGEGYAGLLAWADHAGLVEPAQYPGLAARAAEQPRRAARVVTDVRRLRRAVTDTFSALIAQQHPSVDALAGLRDAYATAVAGGDLCVDADGVRWDWTADDVAAPLWALAASAVDLLTSDRVDRVKQCAGDRCWVLYLDTTRNNSRRWCLMRYCGNVAKSRNQAAHRRAARASPSTSPGPASTGGGHVG